MATDYPPHALDFATWRDYRRHISGANDGKVPFHFWWIEDGLVCHIAKAFGVDRSVIDEVLHDASQFPDLHIACQHPAQGGMRLEDADKYFGIEEEVEKAGGPCEWSREDHKRRHGYYPGEGNRKKSKKSENRRSDRFRYWLYHIYGEGDRLLYIGITRNPTGRESSHRSRWGDLIERFEWEQFDSAESVMAEEKRLIALHNPPFNAEHVGAEL